MSLFEISIEFETERNLFFVSFMCVFFRKEKWRKNTKLTCWFPSTNREHPHEVRIASHHITYTQCCHRQRCHNSHFTSPIRKRIERELKFNCIESYAIKNWNQFECDIEGNRTEESSFPLPLPLFINRTIDIGLELKFEFESNLIVGWRWPCSAWWMVCFRRNSTDTNYSLDIRVAAGDCFYLFSTWAPQHRNFVLLIFDKSFSKWFWLDSWQITTSGNENVFEATMCVAWDSSPRWLSFPNIPIFNFRTLSSYRHIWRTATFECYYLPGLTFRKFPIYLFMLRFMGFLGMKKGDYEWLNNLQ